MEDMRKWMQLAVEKGASDIFIGAGRRITVKLDGMITPLSEDAITVEGAEEAIKNLYEMARRSMDKFIQTGDDDFSVSVHGIAHFRVNAYHQRGTMAAVIRIVLSEIPDYKALHIPDEVMNIAARHHGLVLVTGAAGSGKTTTLACVINAINMTRNGHIITLEDPIEFLHRDAKSFISQREITNDTNSYITALRTCLRQAPDIILIGEMRDRETIKMAVTAAETGQLVISTLHTTGAANTINRIIDVFPPTQQEQIRVQLSMLLQTVVSQQLLPNKQGGLIPAFEIMHLNSAIRNLIRESKIHQIDSVIQTSAREGMISMDAFILKLFQNGDITADAAIGHSVDHEQMARRLGV